MDNTIHSEVVQSQSANRYTLYWAVGITFLVTVLITSFAWYVLKPQFRWIQAQPMTVVQEIKQEQPPLIKDLELKLFQTRVALWQEQNRNLISSLLYDFSNPYIFYFAMMDSDAANAPTQLYTYNVKNDPDYTKYGEIDIRTAKSLQTVSSELNEVVRIAGMYDNKLVYYMTSRDDSPGPCYEAILSDFYRFMAVDMTTKKASAYTPTNAIIQQKTKEEADCMATLE